MAPTVRQALIAGGLGILFLSAGCATDKSSQAKEVTRPVISMQTTRQELVKAQVQVDNVLTAMDRLRAASAAELPRAYEAFTREVSQTASQADIAHQRAGQMQQHEQQYIASWEREIDQLSAPATRAGATERRQAVHQNYPRLQEAARTMDAAYAPFLAQLRGIQKALSLDLTPAGVKAARSAFESARNTATELKERIANFIAQLDLVLAGPHPKK